MNEMRVASMAFAAYLLSSALGQSIIMMGAPVRVNGRVELLHQLGRARVLGADHDAVRLHEIVDGRALLEELRVAHDAERVRGLAPNDVPHFDRGAHGHGALVDDDLVAVHRAGNLARHAQDVLKIGRTVLARRRADGDEDDLCLANAAGERRREREPFLALVPADHLLEAGLVDGDLPALQQTGP